MPETKTNRLEMQTTLCKTDREEIKELLEHISNVGYVHPEYEQFKLINTPAFKRLQAIASQEVHPSGDQSLLSNLSIYSWERLISMRDEAMKLFFNGGPQAEIEGIIQREIERRLLALLPQEK